MHTFNVLNLNFHPVEPPFVSIYEIYCSIIKDYNPVHLLRLSFYKRL